MKYFSFSVLKLAVCPRMGGNGLDWMWGQNVDTPRGFDWIGSANCWIGS